MGGRKKKLSVTLKRWNVVLLIVLIAFIGILCYLLGMKLFGNKDYYEVQSREENIKKSKKSDTPDHETIGWVRVQGTNIDYPVYGVLSRDFDYPVVSDTFTWSLSDDSEFHNTMLVYGHNIMNLGPQPVAHDKNFIRMEELMNFVYYDFAKENLYMQLSMNGENYLYKIFAVNFMKVRELDQYPKGEFSDTVKATYLDEIMSSSIYDYDVKIDEDDKILSVITCSRFFMDDTNYDFIVTGRLVEEGEKVESYKVSRNKNYVKVDDILKGADEDETKENA